MSSSSSLAETTVTQSFRAARRTGRVVWWICSALVVLLGVTVAVARIGLPLLDGQKTRLETALTSQLQSPVTIGTLSLRWQGAGPQLRARDVLVGGEQRRAPLAIDEVRIDVDFLATLWAQVPRLTSLALVGVDLVIDHAPGETPRLRGLSPTRYTTTSADGTSGGASSDDAAPASLASLMASPSAGRLKRMLGDARLAMLETRISLENRKAGTRTLIEPLDLHAALERGHLRLRADLRFPATPRSHLSIDVDVDGPVSERGARSPGGFGANVLVDMQGIELQDWQPLIGPYVDAFPIARSLSNRLDAAFDAELWGRWEARTLQSLRGTVTARDITDTRHLATLPTTVLGNIDYQETEHGWQLATDDVLIESRDHQSRIESLRVERLGGEQARWQLTSSGEVLSLGDVAGMAALVPGKTQTWLNTARPAGRLLGWQSALVFDEGGPQVSLHGQFEGLRSGAYGGLPAFDGLEGAVAIDQGVGDLTVRGRAARFSQDVFNVPLTPDVLLADLSVDFSQPASSWLKGDVVLHDRGLESRSRLAMRLHPGQSPHVDMQTRFNLADLEQSVDYLPVGTLPPPVSRWLERFLQGGRATDGEMLLFGRLGDFPFDNGEGVFKVGFDLQDGTLAFLPGWPTATAVAGRVEFDGTSLDGIARRGRLGGLQISRARARIDDLRSATLAFEGTGKGELQGMIDFANEGPLARWLRPALIDVVGSGDAEMDIAISVPLKGKPAGTPDADADTVASSDSDSLSVKGALFLAGNDVSFERAGVTLAQSEGAVNFDTTGVHLNNLKARFLDQPVLLSGRTEGDGESRATLLGMTGALDATTVLEHYELPLTRFVSGVSKWAISLRAPHHSATFARDGVQLSLESDLVGTRLALPAPLAKSSAGSAGFSLSTALHDSADDRLWQLRYADQMQAQFSVSTGDEGLVSLAAHFGENPAFGSPAEGIVIDGTVRELGFDGWVESISALIDDLPDGGEPQPIMPVELDLQVDSLLVGSTPMGSADITTSSDETSLHATIDNEALRASLSYPREYWRRELVLESRVAFADMRFFDALSAEDAGSEAAQAETASLDPRLLPSIEARISRFKWEQLDLQDVSLALSPTAAGLQIDTVGFAYRNTQLRGDGYWHVTDDQSGTGDPADPDDAPLIHTTGLTLALISDNFGSDLSRLGYAGVLDEGQGEVAATLSWQGPAYLPELTSLSGDVSINLAAGRILGVNPGAARMVGLFALQALPRRINLDFKDIVRDGLDFQQLGGQIRLDKGVASTDLVQLTGPVGVVDIVGSSSIVDETYAQTVTILPRVSAALPVIGLISAGASGGIGALVAGGVLKAIGIDFDRLGLREYRLGGTWDEPTFTSVGSGTSG